MNFGLTELIILIVIAAGWTYPWWRIFKKTGNSPWTALLMFIPLVNIISIWWLALARWPVEEELAVRRRGDEWVDLS